jgi:hypothetical protein
MIFISGSSEGKRKFQQQSPLPEFKTELTFSEMFHDLLELASQT